MDTPVAYRALARSVPTLALFASAFLIVQQPSVAADAGPAPAPAAAPAAAPRGGAAGPLTFSPSVPAPVPAVVAIPRPTAQELDQLNASLQRFMTQADPATKALLGKFPDVIAVRPPRAINPAVVPSLNAGFRTKHNANLEVAKQGTAEVLFMGDSITDFWRNTGAPGVVNPPSAGKAVFDKYFGTMKVANFGISGDTTQGVLYRLMAGEGQGFQPKAIMLMIGTNNSAAASSAEIAEGVGAIVMEMRKDFPAAKILLLAIFPRGDPGSAVRKTVLDVNPIIAKLADNKNVFYLDIGARFLDTEGNIPADIMPDKLHPTEKGYEIWAQAVIDPLKELLK
jgi:lysophospholipase L1-like esterase